MERICPMAWRWNEIFQQLLHYARDHHCKPPRPPTPLILGAWGFTNDVEKRMRWQETIAWAGANGCSPLVEGIREEDFYQVHEPTAYDEIGPLGGPCYRPWDFEAKTRPSHEDIVKHLNYLKSYWPDLPVRNSQPSHVH